MVSSAFPLATNFDPTFGDAAEKLRAAAAAKGISTHYISGVRSKDDQAQLYANYQAGRAGRPLPYPDRGPVSLAAVPGASLHERGLAADIAADDPSQESQLWSLAPQFGLRAKGASDPDHFEIASIPKGGGVPGSFAYGGDAPSTATAYTAEPPPRPSSPAVSAIDSSAPPVGQQPMTHEQFIRDYASKIGVNPDLAVGIANAEGLRAWSAQNPNAASYVDRTAGVPWSFGDFQLNTRNGMGADALKAGIDPRDPKQWQAADQFALDQMKSGGLAPWKGDPFAASWMKSGQPITGTGSAIASAATAEPGIGSGIPTPAAPNPTAVAAETPPPAAPQNAGDWFKKLVARPPPTTDAKGNPVQAKSPLENIASSFKPAGGQQQAPAPQPAQFAPPQDPMAGLAGPSSQMFQAVSQAAARPLSWTSTPYGSVAGQQYPGRGTTLNSMGDLYG